MGKKVLVVDDSTSIRDLVSMTLEVLGDYDVDVGADGLQAQSLLQQHDYELVLTDLDMPNMGGDELIAWMKTEERTRHLPIIVLTAGVDKIREEIAHKYQIQHFLEKPFKPKALVEIIQQML